MRLLELVFYLLRCNSKVTIKELSNIFNVSTKTIQRDLDKLSVLGVPVIIYRGVNGGVEIDKNYIIAKHVLKYDDYKSLIFALYIGENISENISKSFLIDKFKTVDNERCSGILSDIKEKFVVDLFEEKFDTEEEICKIIEEYLGKNLYLVLEVEEREMEVHPISFVLRKEGLCLYCYNDEYFIIPIRKITKAKTCDKKCDIKLIKYKENKEKVKII